MGMDLCDPSSSPSPSTGACFFQRAKCMGVHFFGSWFMSLPLRVLTAPEVKTAMTK